MEKWTCSNCHSENEIKNDVCLKCGLHKEGFDEESSEPQTLYTEEGVEIIQSTSASSHDSALSNIASIILCLGIVASVILFILPFAISRDIDRAIATSMIISAVCLLFSSIVTWALLKEIATISYTLKQINEKLK